uniref:DBR1 domain-containing protein n=1 Tax=Caenorhabditis tropicalis TaxID=1561998 RepID=A0A1I7TD38_9PELO
MSSEEHIETEEERCCGSKGEGVSGTDDHQDPAPEPLITEKEVGTGQKKVRIAVVGCSHGEMDAIYETMAKIEEKKNYKFDLLICCGDYQAVRNYGDLPHMSIPAKYSSLQTFYKYYSGEKVAPVLTIFIGGNHEASGYLCELPNGGWVAPKIYYMGFANCIQFAGLRIAGLSGIYSYFDFDFAHFERPSFSGKDVKTVYHVRNVDMFRLRQLKPANEDKSSNPIDIMLSHDWPTGIPDYGDKQWLFRMKDQFEADHENGKLGNPAGMKLIYECRPRYYLAAHLHIAFAALFPHKGSGTDRPQPTRFLSLDKPIPGRQFMQALEINVAEDAKMELSYDPHWLAILKNTDLLTTAEHEKIVCPDRVGSQPCVYERKDFRPTAEELEEIEKLGDLTIKTDTFRHTAPPLKEDNQSARNVPPSAYYRNPQSAEFCQWLGIRDLNQMLIEKSPEYVGVPFYMIPQSDESDSKPNQDDVDFGDEDFIIDRGHEDHEPETKKSKLEPEEVIEEDKNKTVGGEEAETQ